MQEMQETGSIPGQEDPLEKAMATQPVFLPGEIYGQRSLLGYSPRGCEDLDTTERLTHTHTHTHTHINQKEFVMEIGKLGGRRERRE